MTRVRQSLTMFPQKRIERTRSSLLALSIALVAAGCAAAPSVQPGLSNAPSVRRRSLITSEDVIANGPESCRRAAERSDAGGDQPLEHANPNCERK